MTTKLTILADLFTITYAETRDLEQTIAVILNAAGPGKAWLKLATALRRRQRNGPRLEACRPIIEATATEDGLTVADLTGSRSTVAIASSRYKAYWRLSKAGFPFRLIAQALGRSAPSCVSKGVRRFEKVQAAG